MWLVLSRLSGVQTSIGVRVWATSTVYVANEVLRTWIEIVGLRGLDNRRITSNLEKIMRGIQTWVSTRDLKKGILEVFYSRTNKVVDRWDMSFNYDIDGVGEPNRYRTEMKKLKDFASKLGKLKPGCKYRIVVELEEGAPSVEGWAPTSLRSTSHLKKSLLGGFIETAKINVEMEYWGET